MEYFDCHQSSAISRQLMGDSRTITHAKNQALGLQVLGGARMVNSRISIAKSLRPKAPSQVGLIQDELSVASRALLEPRTYKLEPFYQVKNLKLTFLSRKSLETRVSSRMLNLVKHHNFLAIDERKPSILISQQTIRGRIIM